MPEIWIVNRMKQPSDEYNHTPATLLVAVLGGACAFISIESIFPDVMDSLGHKMNRLQGWQVHMGSASVGIMAFLTLLFILELLETKSNITAWRSSAPWLPLAGLTALAAVIHISFYIVLPAGTIYGVWAYRRTCSVRRSLN